jgi:hypothetical protein
MNLNVEQIQPDFYYRLLSEPFFNSVTIFKIREKRLDTQVSQALAGIGGVRAGSKAGATLEVLMPSLLSDSPNVRGPMATIEMRIITREQPTINLGANGTGLTSETLALAVIQTFDGSADLSVAGGLSWFPAPVMYEPLPLQPDKPFLGHVVKMRANVEFTALPKLSAPAITWAGDTFTLTDTSGQDASLYYTQDGSFPGPGSLASLNNGGTALLYAAPVAVFSGRQIRATAYLPSSLYIGSDTIGQTAP